MLLKKLPHLLVALLIATLAGCASTNPLADEAESQIQDQNYKAALETAEQSIQKHPQDPLGYYYKGVALGEIASDMEDPAERAKYYERMNEAFAEARDVASKAEEVPSQIERISAVKNVLWQNEHNRAVKLATNDSLKNTVQDPLNQSMQHLQNATKIQPDSTLSWNVLSQVSAMNQNFQQAAEAKTKYISMVNDTTVAPEDYIQLASYYFKMDKQQKVLETFEKAQEQFPKNEDIVSNLADAYSRTGQSDKAIATVKNLVEQFPDNPQYNLVLGTQIYQRALQLTDSLTANTDKIMQLKQGDAANADQQITQLQQENEQLQSQIEDLTQRAEDQLQQVIEQRPNDAAAYNTLGIIYQNRAKAVFDQRNRTTDNKKAAELDKQGRKLLKEAMGYYEKAAEINPDNKEYWKSLFSIYTALGMDEKAKEAMKKGGLQ